MVDAYAGDAAVTSARDVVLGRIRAAVGQAPAPGPVRRDYRTDSGRPPGSLELLDLFEDRLVDYRAAVHRCAPGEVAGVVEAVLAARFDRPARVVVPADLAEPWAGGAAVVDDALSPTQLDALDGVVTACAVAIAETGTIVLDAGAGQGRRAITLVPDLHLCVVRADQVVGSVPEALRRLDPLRPLTFISGPSATSDIELSRVEGVHGPRTLVVVLVEQR